MHRPTLQYLTLGEFAKLNRRSFRADVVNGDVFVVRQALQSAGCLAAMVETSLRGISAAAGEQAASAVRQEGFESLHRHVRGDVVFDAYRVAYAKYKDEAPKIVPTLLRFLFGNGVYFYEESPNVRFHVPYEHSRRLPGIGDFGWSGKIAPHGPHHDSWYHCPRNSIDVWAALGRITKGNGLSIYPDVFGKYLPCDDRGVIGKDQRFGRPFNFEMEAGDVLIFNGEHLHSSELNSTAATRHVVSFRITFGFPIFLGKSPYRYNYRLVRIGKNPMHRLRKAMWAMAMSRLKRRDGRNGRPDNDGYTIGQDEFPKTDDVSVEIKTDTALISALETGSLSFGEVLNLTKIAKEAAQAIAPALCIARTGSDEIVLFSRYCPHQGADLGAGYIEGSSLFCPWHNLAIDLRDGTTSCSALHPVKVLGRWAAPGEETRHVSGSAVGEAQPRPMP